MRYYHIRTVKNNRILLLGKVMYCPNLKNGELDGMRFAFRPLFCSRDQYDFDEAELEFTERLYRVLDKSTEEEYEEASRENRELLWEKANFKWKRWIWDMVPGENHPDHLLWRSIMEGASRRGQYFVDW